MEYPCYIIRDLISVYVMGGCSPETEMEVSQHIRQCRECAEAFCQVYDEAEQQENRDILKQLIHWLREHHRKLLKAAAAVLALCVLTACGYGAWWGLTQVDCIPVTPEDYRVARVLEMADGDIYCEYYVRYHSTFTHHYVISDEAVYFTAKRPVLDKTYANLTQRDGKWLMDPDSVWDQPNRQYISVDAIYLGNPEAPEDTVLIWQRGLALPAASPQETAEIEAQDWIIF